jgi:hypothetical protein
VLISPVDGRGWLGMLGNLEEIGEWFVEILTESSFPCNLNVRIQSKTHQLEGKVESCIHEKPLGFLVKVKLNPESRWSDRWFTPKHLLQLWKGPETKVSTLKVASGY